MGVGSGKSMQMLSFEENGSIFANCAYLKLACAAGKRYSARNGGVEQDEPPMDGVMTEGYGQRFGERLRVEKELARECLLSSAHFSRAFRRSVGMAPHDWLIEQRIVLSRKKLRDDRLSLSDVAAECGFTDQSHFTRMFNRIVGVSPGAWRRALKE
jgi:AraC-like DNA-binding protein